MADYIDRNEAIAALTEFRDDQTVSKYVSVENCMVARGAIERATKVLESLPAADVEPVVHGRWIEQEKYTFGVMYDCSICGNRILDNGHSWNYCPNCGARMDEEVDHAQE